MRVGDEITKYVFDIGPPVSMDLSNLRAVCGIDGNGWRIYLVSDLPLVGPTDFDFGLSATSELNDPMHELLAQPFAQTSIANYSDRNRIRLSFSTSLYYY